MLRWHLFENATRPEDKQNIGTWNVKRFAAALNCSERAVRLWLADRNRPNDLHSIEWELFESSCGGSYEEWRQELRAAYNGFERGKQSSSAPQHSGKPYPGLRAFSSEESRFFFGREQEAAKLLARLQDPDLRFVAVVGASGTGKSSLVFAGLLPSLHKEGVDLFQLWFTPGFAGDNPFMSLAVELCRKLPPDAMAKPTRIALEIAEDPSALCAYINPSLAGRASSNILLIIDQFEEIFRSSSQQYRTPFILFIRYVIDQLRGHVLITLRGDFLQDCLIDVQLAELLGRPGSFVPLSAPTEDVVRRMILAPAQVAGISVEDAVTDRLLKDAGSRPGESLPLLAFCLDELYRRTAPEYKFTISAYEEMGGLQGIIGRRATAILQGIDENVVRSGVLSRLFEHLVNVDAAGKAVRMWALKKTIGELDAPIPVIADALTDGGLFVAANTDEGAVIALRHEALLREWPDLRDWLSENREILQKVQRNLMLLSSDDERDRLHALKSLRRATGRASERALGAIATATKDNNPKVQAHAFSVLRTIGPAAATATSALVDIISDARSSLASRVSATNLLADLAPSERDVIRLIELIKVGSEEIKSLALSALRSNSLAVPGMVSILFSNVGHRDESIRMGAGKALGNIAYNDEDIVRRLLDKFNRARSKKDGTDEAGARGAAYALAQIGESAEIALPALLAALADRNREVRLTASVVAMKIAPNEPKLVSWLLRSLADPEQYFAVRCAWKLGGLSRTDPTIVPKLIAALDDEKRVWRVLSALRECGPAAQAALPRLALLQRTHPQFKSSIEDIIDQTRPADAAKINSLINELQCSEADARSYALYALGEIGPPASAAIPILEGMLRPYKEGVRRDIIKTMKKIKPDCVFDEEDED